MRLIAAAAIALLGCDSAPDNPTWTADVKPILQANCIKCHGKIPRGGAPSDFRLDSYFGGTTADGRPQYGAALVALFAYERTHAETMPPVVPLSGVQIDTLGNWFDTGAPFGDPVASNAPPAIELQRPLADSLDPSGFLVVQYRITDPDFDVVSGGLAAVSDAGSINVPGELYSGSGAIAFDAAAAPEGSYELIATLSDGNEMFGSEVSLGSFEVAHPDNAAPTVAIASPRPDELFPRPALVVAPAGPETCGDGTLDSSEGCDDGNEVDGDGCSAACRVEDGSPCNDDQAGRTDNASCDSGFCDVSAGTPGVCRDASNRVVFTVDDGDAGDQLDVIVTAIRGDESMEIAVFDNIGRGRQSVVFDPPASLAGGSWTIRVGVTDGQLSRSAAVEPLVFTSGPASSVGFDPTIRDLLGAHCSGCHRGADPGEAIFAAGTSFNYVDIDNVRRTFGGEVYRRVVQDLTMPARSTEILNGRELMPQADRDRVAEWILGGAPP